MDIIRHYFPGMHANQLSKFKHLEYLCQFWNKKINLISRQDISNLYVHHYLHSLSIAKFIEFTPGTKILDMGTGGGFPGLPLAILFPQVQFHLVDVMSKKIRAVEVIYRNLALQNVTVQQIAAEALLDKYDFVVSRAVGDMSMIHRSCKHLIRDKSSNDYPNGLICLKGGNLVGELTPFKDDIYTFHLQEYYKEDFFRGKYLVYLPA